MHTLFMSPSPEKCPVMSTEKYFIRKPWSYIFILLLHTICRRQQELKTQFPCINSYVEVLFCALIPECTFTGQT